MGNFCCQKIDPLIAFVNLPREIIIENRRLGLLHVVLTVLVGIWVIYNFIYSRAWNLEHIPVHGMVELWSGSPSTWDATVKHCTDLSYYNYDWSSTFMYRPTKCMRLPEGENQYKLGSRMYITTYAVDSYYVGGVKQWSLEFLTQNVDDLMIYFNHGYQVTTQSDKVVRGRDKFQGEEGTLGGSMSEISGEQGQMLTIFQDSSGSRECVIGGKSRWKPRDALSGISGKLSEFLACGGISLDDYNHKVKTNSAVEVGTPTYRITGAGLKLEHYYYNSLMHSESDWAGTVCYIRVRTVPIWNSNQIAAHTTVYDGTISGTNPSASDVQSAYRFRYQYGVSVELEALGTFSLFDYQALITGLVNALVLLALPTAVIKVIACKFCGPISAVYERSQAEPVDLNEFIYGAVARKFVYAHVFKQLAKEGKQARGGDQPPDGANVTVVQRPPVATVPVALRQMMNAGMMPPPGEGQLQHQVNFVDGEPTKPPVNALMKAATMARQEAPVNAKEASLDPEHVGAMLQEALLQCVQDGTLDEQEINLMSEAILHGLDHDGGDSLQMHEFVESCSFGDKIGPTEIGALFDKERRAGCLERLLTDNKMKHMLDMASEGGSEKRKVERTLRRRTASLQRIGSLHETDGADEATLPPQRGRSSWRAIDEEAIELGNLENGGAHQDLEKGEGGGAASQEEKGENKGKENEQGAEKGVDDSQGQGGKGEQDEGDASAPQKTKRRRSSKPREKKLRT
ncbi:unnamed protein product [Amoebophrya sp. A25]|nr:unnamed protein product [Amoebophrya sp. A25]|eukprot:GSA25T00013986001.1